MRSDNVLFETDNMRGDKRPRYVVSIDFDGTLQYLTSHDDIANVPGSPIQNSILGISATSQTLNPDRANATIGSMSFDIVDLASAFTNKVRTELDTNDAGLRGRTVKFYMGYLTDQSGAGILDGSSTDDNPDFDNFILFQTQVIQTVETKEGRYSIKCADIQRQTKKQIFDLALTYFTASLTDSATTVSVLDLSGFEGNNHGTSYTDAPSSNVIYIKIDKTKEIIRCPVSGISGNDFTGVTRGVFGTKAQAVEVDLASASDRRPKVEEYVYLELPAVKLAYAILTGDIEGTADVLPSSWHAGVATSFVRLTDFTGIGNDLWDTTDDTKGIILRFDGIEKQDAKKFLETEIYLLLGLFSPVYADGQLGLQRMVPALSDSPYSFEVDSQNTISGGNLRHDMQSMQNNLRIDWNWNGDRFIRSTIIIDSKSITRHGTAPEKRLGFRGLVGTRFTEQVLRQLLTSLRDMYTGPPLRLDLNCFHLMNALEVGDAVRVDLSHLRDYTQAGSSLQRTMVIHGMTVDWLKGVKLKLFGSSERADEIPPVTATQCLLDAFYPSVGASLSTIPGLMTGDATNAGTFTLTGNVDMNATGAIFYWDNPLTISSGTTLIIEENVQLRVKGFLTINGTIDGIGEGIAAGASLFDLDQHYYWSADRNVGNPGFIGNTRSQHGLLFRHPDEGGYKDWVYVTASYFTKGSRRSFPNVVLVVDDAGSGSVTGIPTDMRGGGGAHGPRAGHKIGHFGRTHQKADGGVGGAGGAALCIISRGGDFGISGQITLDGADSAAAATFWVEPGGDFDIYGGAGAPGAPGALLWLLDGSSVTFPDLAGHFQAMTGAIVAPDAMPYLTDTPQGTQNRSMSGKGPWGGPLPRKNSAPLFPDRIDSFDQTGVNFRILFLPCDVVPEDDQDTVLSPPTGITATTILSGVAVSWTNTNQERPEVLTEIWRANEDVRASAVLIATVAGEIFDDTTSDLSRNRYYWVRAVDLDGNTSLYEPDTSTTTAIAAASGGQPPVTADPLIRLGASFWTLTNSGGSAPTYVVGVGTKGTDVINFAGNAIAYTAAHKIRRGLSEWDHEAIQGMSVEIRYRMKYSVAGSGGWTDTFFPRVQVTDENELNARLYNGGAGSGMLFDNTSTLGTWIEKTVVVALDQETTETPPRFIQVRVTGDGNANGAEYQLDMLDATVQAGIFGGASKVGLVPDPVTEAAKFLKDDGTWDDPPGGAASDSFVTHTVTDTDSGFTWAATGSAIAITPTDVLTYVSGVGIDIDVDAALDAIRFTLGAFGDLSDVDLTGAANNDLLFRSAGNWIDTAGEVTWDGAVFEISGGNTLRLSSGADSVDFQISVNTLNIDFASLTLVDVSADADMTIQLGDPTNDVNLQLTNTSQIVLPSSTTGFVPLFIAEGPDKVTPLVGDVWHSNVTDSLKIHTSSGTKDLAAGADVTANENVTGQWDFNDVVRLIPSGSQTGMLEIHRFGASADSFILFRNDLDTINEATVGWDTSDDAFVVRMAGGNDIRLEANVSLGDKIFLAPSSTGSVDILGLLQCQAGVTGNPSLNIPEGVAPSSPVDGDVWLTTNDMFARINGVSESLIGAGGGGVASLPGQYRGVTNQNLSTSVITVDLQTEDLDPDANYSVSADIVTIVAAGYYLISYEVYGRVAGGTGNARATLSTWITKNGTVTILSGSYGSGFMNEANNPVDATSAGATFIHQFAASDTVRIRATLNQNQDQDTVATKTHLTLMKVRD